MMDQEMLDAMKTLLKPISSKLDSLELKLDVIQLNQKVSERAIRKDINYLNDEVETLIAVLEAKDILLKVNNL